MKLLQDNAFLIFVRIQYNMAWVGRLFCSRVKFKSTAGCKKMSEIFCALFSYFKQKGRANKCVLVQNQVQNLPKQSQKDRMWPVFHSFIMYIFTKEVLFKIQSDCVARSKKCLGLRFSGSLGLIQITSTYAFHSTELGKSE